MAKSVATWSGSVARRAVAGVAVVVVAAAAAAIAVHHT
jgi:hypothetical protein